MEIVGVTAEMVVDRVEEVVDEEDVEVTLDEVVLVVELAVVVEEVVVSRRSEYAHYFHIGAEWNPKVRQIVGRRDGGHT